MKLKDLYPHPQNPRKITDEKLLMLKKSLGEFGDLSGVIYNLKTKRLIGGHQRLKVLPPDTVISIDPSQPGQGYFELGGDRFVVRLVKWDEDKEKAAMIAANQHGGEWAYPLLPDLVAELDSMNIDMELLGFDEEELKNLMAPISGETKSVEGEDDIPEKVEAKTKPGDLYQLGNHRLMCGDSTSIDAVDKLMDGERACMMFTSPPYNLGSNAKLRGYNGDGKDSAYIEKTDHKTDEEYLSFLTQFTSNGLIHCDTAFVNIQILAGNKFVIPKYWTHFQKNLIDIAVWDKEHAQPSAARRVLNSVWEFIFIFSKDEFPTRSMKHGPDFRGTIDNIYRLNPVGKKDPLAKDHGAVFPVQFCEHFVSKFSDQSVLDLFGGSGSTLIACEKTKRKCFMMEIDPHYCDIIIERWQRFTGKKAELLDGKNPKKETKVIKKCKK